MSNGQCSELFDKVFDSRCAGCIRTCECGITYFDEYNVWDWINIGANTNYKIKLTEPPPNKIIALIEELKNNITEVKIKPNLKRLMKGIT